MTLTQLEYVVAIDTYRHFVAAAEKCFVTQPTLSMQIQKLEEELGVKIFDRTKQPVIPTEIGESIIAQARVVLHNAAMIRQIISDLQDAVTGELRMGIIPTLAPYLLPPLYKYIREKYPQIDLVVREALTEEVVGDLKNNRLDCGVVVTPLKDNAIREDAIFYEELFVYVSRKNALADKRFVLASDIDPSKLWLLEEGHCFRAQVLNLCELRKRSGFHFQYETGNIDTLKRMVDKSDGVTILPELAVMEFTNAQRRFVKRFRDPAPAREVSVVTHRDYVKTRLINTLKAAILHLVPPQMQRLQHKKVVDIQY